MFTGLLLLALNEFGKLLILSLVSMITSILFSLLLINVYGLIGSAMVLPGVAIISTVTGIISLRQCADGGNLKFTNFISPLNLYNGIKDIYLRVR